MESPRAYIDRLIDEALSHRAVSHPYLHALRTGDLPDPAFALRDLSHQYLAYSASFPRYLAATIAQLEDPVHREQLLHNLSEESGHLDAEACQALCDAGVDPSWAQGVPHPVLYRRFLAALGQDEAWLADHPFRDEVLSWSALFLQCCRSGSPAMAVGALGLGTETVVSTIYAHMIEAIERFLEVSREERVFFDLHCTVDDEHGEVLKDIAVALASRGRTEREDLRKGMLMALNLRASFYDATMASALAPVAERVA